MRTDLQNPVDRAFAFFPAPAFMIVAGLLMLTMLALAIWAYVLNRRDERRAEEHLRQLSDRNQVAYLRKLEQRLHNQ